MSMWRILRTIFCNNTNGPRAIEHASNGCCISADRYDSVFHAQKPLQGGRQAKAQFLPGQHLASSAKSRRSYAARNAVPVLQQVRPASVEQRAEIEVERMSREDIANELVRDVFSLRPGKLAKFEYFSKISV